jgi:hypothetical protein
VARVASGVPGAVDREFVMSKSVEAFERKYGKRDSLFNSFISYAEYDEALKIWNAAYESLSIQQEADAKEIDRLKDGSAPSSGKAP